MKKLLLIANPKAGKCMAKKVLFDLVSVFSGADYKVTVYPTKRHGTEEYVRSEAAGYDLVVCCGGDGTLSEVLGGVYASGAETPVGYIPMGSTNDFAANMNIPRNPKLAALGIINGKVVPHDLGSINGKYFSYILATGAFTGASYSAPQRLKNSLGHFAYILEGSKYLAKIKPFHLKAIFDGKRTEGDFIYASVSNTTSVGGIVKLAKEAVNFNDGSFELMLVKKPANIKESAELITAILSNNLNCSCIRLYHASKVNMLFDKDPCFTVDGEKLEASKEVTVQNHMRAVNLVLPKKRFG